MTTQIDFDQARFNMIEQQIRTWEVLDQSVLNLLNNIHREDYVPAEYKALALADTNIPLEHDQLMMSPKLEARILQSIDIRSTDTVLEIGTGSGYLTALLASVAKHVDSVDLFSDFTQSAQLKLSEQGMENVSLSTADGLSLDSGNSTYDAVIITGSLIDIPDSIKQKIVMNGKIFAIIGEPPIMDAQLITRIGEDHWSVESLFETSIPALIGAEKKTCFSVITPAHNMDNLSAGEVSKRLNASTEYQLIDVREQWEWDICHIAQSRHIPMNEIPERATEISREMQTVVICHHGARSMQVAAYLESLGFDNLINLDGGIDSWAQNVDSSLERY